MSTSSNTSFEFIIHHNGEFKLNPVTYQDGSVFKIHVPDMDFDNMVSYLNRKCIRRVHKLYYELPPINNLQGMKAIKRDYDVDVMYDIAKVAGILQIYVSHQPIDLGTVLIPNDGSLEEALGDIISEETKLKLEESLQYLHQLQKQKNRRFDIDEFLAKLGYKKKSKLTTPYTQTIFNFLVHNNGQLICNGGPPKYVNGLTMNISIPRMKLEELKQYLFNILDTKIHALYYEVPHTGFSSTVRLRNNYDMHVMFDISAAQGKLEFFIDHVGVDFIIAKYICRNTTLAEMMNHVITDYTSDSEDRRKEVTQNDYTYDQMVEWAEQEHLENEDAKADERHRAIWKNRIY